ncbi:CDP-diacylglycerol--serine O-phosphatidyltransferase [Chelatococcus daeguensis]|uniref:CDP-diacylglycerol--serine O-phosphatidyltransferase n=2 Tax=Chelatococcus TaxID=28209 RepID=A0AAC9JP60_9HYPH|nr:MULTISPECIES: CDP-diacylglycerol--serine O-phosphatidyltransferase [Chelatococcus]APF37138.1 CDP-diacylglycerol--serine O-phosphatidyltransferase [Chelatococcus daeguensis]KZE35656.1 CDP-diacylglycerol--serine O-phosphatidyltransferase [Chelatococcus daeguensis]MBM3084935.1 CDP-diacylglycerol--serine O-phosphatidyltransferase [Chelatococcus daeguensis]CUA87791.1 CDP-diacylglycerol--serine O-phosphatidyltransferase [Chelatococcus sambhunathii]
MTDLFPPFAPDPEEARRRRFTPIPLRVLVPNVITLLALCLGLTAIRLAIEERLEPAMIAIVIAAILDGIDGRVARLLKGTSRFGAELDSLSDFVNFGVAPALILYSFVLHELRSIGWIAALVFAIAAALRLARFNVMIDDPARPDWQKNYFVGMAAPAGAICALLPIYLYMLGLPVDGIAAPFVAAYLVGIAFLMVSRIPTYAGKTLGSRVPREKVLPLFAIVVLFAALLVSFTFQVLAIGVIVYLALIPVGVMRYRRMARADAARSKGDEAAAAPGETAGEAPRRGPAGA